MARSDSLRGAETPTVECLSSHAYADRPIALVWEGQRLRIDRIEQRWRLPQGKRFRVHTEDDRIFQLTYDGENDEWVILPG